MDKDLKEIDSIIIKDFPALGCETCGLHSVNCKKCKEESVEELSIALQSYMRRRVLKGRIESIEKYKLVKDETAKPSNKDMVCIQMTATVPSISIEVMSLFYETHNFTLELMQKALEQKLKSEEGY